MAICLKVADAVSHDCLREMERVPFTARLDQRKPVGWKEQAERTGIGGMVVGSRPSILELRDFATIDIEVVADHDCCVFAMSAARRRVQLLKGESYQQQHRVAEIDPMPGRRRVSPRH